MLIYRNYKYRLYPNKEQIDLLNNHFFTSNQAWNETLAMKMSDLKQNANLAKQDKTYIKDKDIETAMKLNLRARNLNFHSGVVQESFKSMKKSLENFYKKRKEVDTVGFPKFKTSKKIEQSFYFKNQGVSWKSEYFKILKQKIKWKFHREIPDSAKLNSVVIKRESDGKYFAILNLTMETENQFPKNEVEAGIDMNVKNIAISDSNGNSRLIKLEDFSKSKYSKQFTKLQSQLSRRYLKKNFSQNTKRLQKKQNIIHKKIKNKKENQFHQISNEITNNFDRITIENLKIKQMKESNQRFLNRMISDVSWNSLIQKLIYKSEMKNRTIREINPAFTSQRCFKCGYISKNNRKSQSDFSCLNCKNTTNADLNASLNILWYDNWSLEQKTKIDSFQSESLLVQA